VNKRILEKYVYSDEHVLTVFGRLNTHARARTTTTAVVQRRVTLV